jgi:subtilisin family serine protease
LFDPETLAPSRITEPLATQLRQDSRRLYPLIVDVNLEHPAGREAAIIEILSLVREVTGADPLRVSKTRQYLLGSLDGEALKQLIEQDSAQRNAIYRVWLDFPVHALLWESLSTVKADAAHRAFAASGKGVVWAVLDSGIDAAHPHFAKHENLVLEPPLRHMDFTGKAPQVVGVPEDPGGHGTHVAGVLAGALDSSAVSLSKERTAEGAVRWNAQCRGPVAGVAPAAKLVSMRVLDEFGHGRVSQLIAALDEIQEINEHGRRLRIHGVNLSLGYDFEPEWFACGQSPLCVEVNRLVRSGVVVVAAAGNSGHAAAMSINDPGNADLAITVGATHRDHPHVYGVSYFSSKGPTGDGRAKPDLVAPGERILSCAAGRERAAVAPFAPAGSDALYVERSGTSMAAPHVSGAIAAFLSVRREFIGRPEVVKETLLGTATDLKRERYFQGRGLVDLMRALQAV